MTRCCARSTPTRSARICAFWIPSWPTWYVYAEVDRFLEKRQLVAIMEGRFGRSFRLDPISSKLVFFPHAVLAANYDNSFANRVRLLGRRRWFVALLVRRDEIHGATFLLGIDAAISLAPRRRSAGAGHLCADVDKLLIASAKLTDRSQASPVGGPCLADAAIKRPPQEAALFDLRRPYSDYAIVITAFVLRRYATKPNPAKPAIIMTHVEGSGTGAKKLTSLTISQGSRFGRPALR